MIGETVREPWKVMVADRNRHVRDLLKRELGAEGYIIQEARDGREVWQQLTGPEPPDILILDPELPYLEDLVEMTQFRDQSPPVPLIIYAYLGDYPEEHLPPRTVFLEKREDTDRLKEVVAELLRRPASPPSATR